MLLVYSDDVKILGESVLENVETKVTESLTAVGEKVV
jgi:hypothetical protein